MLMSMLIGLICDIIAITGKQEQERVAMDEIKEVRQSERLWFVGQVVSNPVLHVVAYTDCVLLLVRSRYRF